MNVYKQATNYAVIAANVLFAAPTIPRPDKAMREKRKAKNKQASNSRRQQRK